MSRPRQLSRPRPAIVTVGGDGRLLAVERIAVDSTLEDWVVEDRWWTARPVRRRYLELVLANGRCVVVFRDLVGGRWYVQRS